jgi:uncharacterized protein
MSKSPLGIVMRPAHFPGRAQIDAYGNNGFRFADMSHIGSILCLPSGIYGWEPYDPSALQFEDFSKLIEEAGGFDVLLVGMGSEIRPIPKALREALKAKNVVAEPMSTGAAVRTYNVLLAEERRVAAALIAVD